MNTINVKTILFSKVDGLVPVCVQHYETMQVLMLGFMNKEALTITLKTKKLTFYSRSRQCLWTKGQTSGNYLELSDIFLNCEKNSLLCMVKPKGPTCHLNQISCFNLAKHEGTLWFQLSSVYQTILQRKSDLSNINSYTQFLINKGLNEVAKKLGEEAIEVALAAVSQNKLSTAKEVVDLLYHLLVLIVMKEIPLRMIGQIIEERKTKGAH